MASLFKKRVIYLTHRLQHSPYFSASVGMKVARKGSGTSVNITSGIGERDSRSRVDYRVGASRLSILASRINILKEKRETVFA